MEISGRMGHKTCAHHENGQDVTIAVRTLEKGYTQEIVLRRNEIVFIMEGQVCFTFRDYPPRDIGEGELAFIPVGGLFRYQVVETAQVIIFRLNGKINLCEEVPVETLYLKGNVWENSLSGICPLRLHPSLRLFADGLNAVISDGLNCRYYFDTKVRELLVLLNTYYPPEELRAFFSLILTPDTAFSEHVRGNFHRFRGISEIASSMHMSVKHFERVFTRVFGLPPGRWINGQRAQMIRHELCVGDKPIKLISEEYGFSTPQHLTRFCKRELGRNPSELRDKKRHVNEGKREASGM